MTIYNYYDVLKTLNNYTMKILKKTSIALCLFGSLFLTNCSSSDDENDPNNNDPGIFSVNTINLSFDSATIEWTEAIDSDGDTVSYTIFLEDDEIATNLQGFNYTFSGLHPETNYTGYVEARDGNGGTSRANFTFTTEPAVIIMSIPVSFYEYELPTSVNCGGGVSTSLIFLLGGEVPKYEGTTTYQAVFETVVYDGFTFSGRTVTWDNDATTTGFLRVLESGDFFPYHAHVTFQCSNNQLIPEHRVRYNGAAATAGTATVTIIRGSN